MREAGSPTAIGSLRVSSLLAVLTATGCRMLRPRCSGCTSCCQEPQHQLNLHRTQQSRVQRPPCSKPAGSTHRHPQLLRPQRSDAWSRHGTDWLPHQQGAAGVRQEQAGCFIACHWPGVGTRSVIDSCCTQANLRASQARLSHTCSAAGHGQVAGRQEPAARSHASLVQLPHAASAACSPAQGDAPLTCPALRAVRCARSLARCVRRCKHELCRGLHGTAVVLSLSC